LGCAGSAEHFSLPSSRLRLRKDSEFVFYDQIPPFLVRLEFSLSGFEPARHLVGSLIVFYNEYLIPSSGPLVSHCRAPESLIKSE
jgi:hypothetical protein